MTASHPSQTRAGVITSWGEKCWGTFNVLLEYFLLRTAFPVRLGLTASNKQSVCLSTNPWLKFRSRPDTTNTSSEYNLWTLSRNFGFDAGPAFHKHSRVYNCQTNLSRGYFTFCWKSLSKFSLLKRRLKSGQKHPGDAFVVERFAETEGRCKYLQYLSRQTKKQRIAVS